MGVMKIGAGGAGGGDGMERVGYMWRACYNSL